MVFFLFCSPRAAKETGPSQTQPCDTTQLDDKEVMTAKQGLYQKLTTLTNWCWGVITGAILEISYRVGVITLNVKL